jgi:hypothetical protein
VRASPDHFPVGLPSIAIAEIRAVKTDFPPLEGAETSFAAEKPVAEAATAANAIKKTFISIYSS